MPIRQRSFCVESTSICSAFLPRSTRFTNLPTINRPTHMNGCSTACSLLRIMASDGAATLARCRRATPIPTASTRDQPRTIWKYRDWVINAINDNLPFDQFAIEQIAGDLLAKPTLDQLVATGFHRNTLINEEGGTDPEQFRVEAVVDRVNTTGDARLSGTDDRVCPMPRINKYDPISQRREYYQLYAYFNSTEFSAGDPAIPKIDVPSVRPDSKAANPNEKHRFVHEIKRLEQELKDQAANIAADLTAWEQTLTDDDKKKLPFNVKNAVDLPLMDRSEIHKRDLDGYFRGLRIACGTSTRNSDEIARLRGLPETQIPHDDGDSRD